MLMIKKSKDINHSEKQSLQKFTEIRILLTSYNGIFSDFDPSAYAERTLSHDFITQVKNILKNKIGTNL